MNAKHQYTLLQTDGAAKRGRLETVHGVIETPVFMNVGTQAAIKGAVDTMDLKAIGCQVQLSNTYHLHVRPGDELIRSLGGLHRFMNWQEPILTDSGGFQVFSLAAMRRIKEEGVTFQSHVDGRRIFMGPEESMKIQSNLGSTIAMAFDECIENPAPREYVVPSVERTTRWLLRSLEALEKFNAQDGTLNPDQLLFGINQGGVFEDLRRDHARTIRALDLPGYAIGGLAVGESHEQMYRIIEAVSPELPQNKPLYLMGVGLPENILEAVARGVDFFDCVLPARNGRHGHVFTSHGKINLHNKRFEKDERPIDPGCGCPACQNYSRAYLRHLFRAKEMLALRLCVLHNLWFYNHLMADIRLAIEQGRFNEFKSERLAAWSDTADA
ncbi:tRNA-guanine transglycosylase [Clostridiaceae bacterium JG1575]|nr:tRNA-guanine transglycosylase [Clostridiaceae bacterium JG1575]